MGKQQIHGLALGSRSIGITSLEHNQDRWEIVRSREIPLVPDGDASDADASGLGETLRSHAASLGGACSIGLPARTVLLRVVELPTQDADEIYAMVDLQVDKLSPFPVDELIVSHETLGPTRGGTRVMVVAARVEVVEAMGSALSRIGLRADRIDVDVLGWWHLLRDELKDSSGGQVIILTEPEDTVLLLVRDGNLILVRSLGGEDGLDRATYCATLAEDFSYALTSIEAECGGVEIQACTLWHHGAPPEDLRTALRVVTGTDVGLREFRDLPPLSQGLAQRAAESAEGTADLAPPEWEARQSSNQVRRRLVVATAGLMGLWLVVVVSFAGVLGSQKSKLSGIQDRLKALEAPAAEVRLVREKAQFLERYTNRNFSALENLRAITIAMPEGIDINSFNYSKGGSISLRGTADTKQPVFTFGENLQQSDLFKEVQTGQMKEKRTKEGLKITFQFAAQSAGEDL
jgi:Tfp pilus assembly protein PilN